MDLRKREEQELEAYEKTVSSVALSDEQLEIGPRTIERYGSPFTVKKLPVDLLFKTLGNLDGECILDCGCGDGEFSVILGLIGGQVTGIDISETLINLARRRARVNRVDASVKFLRASVHDLPFLEGTFDIVFGKGVLHHTDMTQSAVEISRVLKKGGRAVFEEPIALSSLFQGIRKSKMISFFIKENRITPDEEPLTPVDISTFTRHFDRANIQEVQLFSRFERIFGTGRIFELLNNLDLGLLKRFPALRRLGRLAILEFVK